jgi:hypothetical protein
MITRHYDPNGIGAETIESWFITDDIKEIRIFPGLDVAGTAAVKSRLKKMKSTKFRTLLDIYSECRPCLDEFYIVMEQIPVWLSTNAAKGYQGGSSIVQRPRVDKILTDFCGAAGTAAIYIYVFKHYRELYSIGSGIGVNEADYAKRFMHRIWNNLGKVVLLKWGNVAVYDDFKKRITTYHSKGLRVYSHKNTSDKIGN